LLLTICVSSLLLQTYLWGISAAIVAPFFKHAVLGTTLAVSMMVGLGNVFSVAEASLIAQTAMCSKHLWASSKFNFNQTISYLLLTSTALSISLYLIFGAAKGQSMHPLTLFGFSASMFSISLKLSNITFYDLLHLSRSFIEDFNSRIVVLVWVVGLGIVASLTTLYSSMDLAEKKNRDSLQIRRKSFHLISLCLFLPAAIFQVRLFH